MEECKKVYLFFEELKQYLFGISHRYYLNCKTRLKLIPISPANWSDFVRLENLPGELG